LGIAKTPLLISFHGTCLTKAFREALAICRREKSRQDAKNPTVCKQISGKLTRTEMVPDQAREA
jgi:hypothetical protein